MLNQDKIRISVKGDAEQGRKALEARGIPAEPAASGGRFEDCRSYWDVPASSRGKVVSWFCEPATCDQSVGFPAGTLLYHG